MARSSMGPVWGAMSCSEIVGHQCPSSERRQCSKHIMSQIFRSRPTSRARHSASSVMLCDARFAEQVLHGAHAPLHHGKQIRLAILPFRLGTSRPPTEPRPRPMPPPSGIIAARRPGRPDLSYLDYAVLHSMSTWRCLSKQAMPSVLCFEQNSGRLPSGPNEVRRVALSPYSCT